MQIMLNIHFLIYGLFLYSRLHLQLFNQIPYKQVFEATLYSPNNMTGHALFSNHRVCASSCSRNPGMLCWSCCGRGSSSMAWIFRLTSPTRWYTTHSSVNLATCAGHRVTHDGHITGLALPPIGGGSKNYRNGGVH